MFSYYGSKSQIVNLYPPPKFDRIIEPFAGSARYSLKYFERDILLVDKYDVIIDIWHYLQQCSPNDILSLPQLTNGLLLSELNLSNAEKNFLGMISGIASTSPRNKVSKFSSGQNGAKNRMQNIAKNLFKIKHWKIQKGSYDELDNIPATWFIDPPYQFGGHAYVENKIDFQSLSVWCMERKGQSIVCENTKANWLDFKPMITKKGANNKFTTEAIWSNLNTSFDFQQSKLF